MSEAEARRERIRSKVAASQARLTRESEDLPVPPRRAHFPDAYPPEDYRTLAAEYPWLAVAAGVGTGLLIGALLPKRFGGKLGKRALAVASVAGELGLALSKQARDAAVDAGQQQLAKVSESSAPLRQRAVRAAGSARSNARSAGLIVAREALKLATRVRK
ncbi:MAG: hypothetical protein HOO94_00860 [Novosphingobium sp.]|uniref:hypothetical protein n=1 Tax=Novosphingobium sp. TaxID=1874826 RepID=UPI0017987AB9|nr:hypothetical protein [Novosphingobium sp.]